MPISCYTARNRRKKRSKGFTLGIRFQLRAFKARRGNIIRTSITPSVKYDDLRAVCFKLRVAFVCSTHKQFNFKSTALGRAYLPEGVSLSQTNRFLQTFFAIFT